jgi:hypothetical protein
MRTLLWVDIKRARAIDVIEIIGGRLHLVGDVACDWYDKRRT